MAKEIHITKPLAVGMKLMAKGFLFIVEQFCKIIFLNYKLEYIFAFDSPIVNQCSWISLQNPIIICFICLALTRI